MKYTFIMAMLWVNTSVFANIAPVTSNVISERTTLTKIPSELGTLKVFKDEMSGYLKLVNTKPINSIRIYNTDGKLVRTESELLNVHNLEVGRLVKGTYAIRIQIHKETLTYIFTKE